VVIDSRRLTYLTDAVPVQRKASRTIDTRERGEESREQTISRRRPKEESLQEVQNWMIKLMLLRRRKRERRHKGQEFIVDKQACVALAESKELLEGWRVHRNLSFHNKRKMVARIQATPKERLSYFHDVVAVALLGTPLCRDFLSFLLVTDQGLVLRINLSFVPFQEKNAMPLNQRRMKEKLSS